MVYDPKTPGLDPSVQRELQEIRSEFERSQVEFIEFRVHNAAPSKPKQGRAYYADGTNWNPGSGKGLYSYDGSGWVFLEDQDTAPSTATTSAEGVVELATAAEVKTGTDTGRVPSVSVMGDHQSSAKAWVNFNGQGTIAINDSYNVSSLTDNGTGNYTINLSITMGNSNFATTVNAQLGSSASSSMYTYALTTTSFSIRFYISGSSYDPADVQCLVFGDT